MLNKKALKYNETWYKMVFSMVRWILLCEHILKEFSKSKDETSYNLILIK